MNNCDTYIINMKKDYGKYICSKSVVDVFNAYYVEGIDCNYLDDNGYLVYVKNMQEYTKCAKKIKKEIFEKFINNSSSKYIAIFEDDIYLHKELLNDKKIILDQINNFLKNNDVALLYLGVSRNFPSKNNNVKQINFIKYENIYKNNYQPTSGAYGFILNRNYVNFILTRINNLTFVDNPFDLYCLSYISMIYPDKVYVTDPHLVVPDITSSNIRVNKKQEVCWNSLNINEFDYNIPVIGILYINITDTDKLDIYKKNILMLAPIIKIIYYNNSLDIAKQTNLNILFNMYSSTDKKIKYNSAKLIFDTINQYSNKCQNLFILNKKKENIFIIEYNNNKEYIDNIDIIIDL